MVNLEFLVIVLVVGTFVDWVFQSQWQASNKSNWGKLDNKRESLKALISHSFVYAFITTVVTTTLMQNSDNATFIFIFTALFVSHALIDTRIAVRWIMLGKGLTEEQVNDYKGYGYLHIGIDQLLHAITILIFSCFVR